MKSVIGNKIFFGEDKITNKAYNYYKVNCNI